MTSEKNISAEKISFEKVDDKLISSFLDWLETERKCSISTRNQRLSEIAAFSIYAQNRTFGAAAVFRNNVLKIPKRRRIHRKGHSSFTRDEVKILFELPKTTSEIGLRDKHYCVLCMRVA